MVSSREIEEWRSGLTWRVVLAVLYGAVVLMPVQIWGGLMIGGVQRLTWAVVIFFYWLALLYGKPLTKQEILVMFAAVGTAIYVGVGLNFSSMFYRVWFSESPIVYSYGLEKYIPYWYVPSNKLIRLQIVRTFLHPSWFPVFAVSTIFWVMNVVIGLSLGFFFYQLFVETERLPFPMARVDVEVITELEEREPMRMRIFTLFALFGFIYSFIAYGIPTLSQTFAGFQITLIPFPYLDMTPTFQESLPGAIIGLDTNIFSYLVGFILSKNVIICMLIGSIISSIIGNTLVVRYFPELIPKWVNFPWGMKIPDLLFWSQIYIWYSISIGIAFAVFGEQIIKGRRGLIKATKSLMKLTREAKKIGFLSFKVIISTYLILTIIWFLMVSFFLLKGFPWYPIFFLVVIWPIIFGFITIRAYAETGFYITIPYFSSNILILTMNTYNIPVHSEMGIWPWFAPLGVSSGQGWCSTFFVCKGVKCTFSSYIKAVLLVATPITIVLDLLYSEYLWHMSPIPSSLFQYASIFWPVRAAQSALWYTRKIYGLNPALIIYGLVGMGIVQTITTLLKIPFSSIGLFMGIGTIFPTSLAIFIGHIILKIISKILKTSEESVRKYSYLMAGGYAVGLAVAMSFSIGIAIFYRSLWMLPY